MRSGRASVESIGLILARVRFLDQLLIFWRPQYPEADIWQFRQRNRRFARLAIAGLASRRTLLGIIECSPGGSGCGPEEADQTVNALSGVGIAGECEVSNSDAEGVLRSPALGSELVGQWVIGVFGPGDPDLLDLQVFKQILHLVEAGNVIPVFMGYHEQVDLTVGHLSYVVDHPLHTRRRVGRAQHNATIDQHDRRACQARPEK